MLSLDSQVVIMQATQFNLVEKLTNYIWYHQVSYKDKLAVIGNGVVVDPVALLKELDGLNERGISTNNLRISNRAQVILPYHLAQDEYEERRRGDNKIGTTKKVSAQHT